MDGEGRNVNVILYLCVQDSCANSALVVKLVFIVEGLPHGSVLFLLKFQKFFLRPDKYIRKHAELQGPVRGGDLSFWTWAYYAKGQGLLSLENVSYT